MTSIGATFYGAHRQAQLGRSLSRLERARSLPVLALLVVVLLLTAGPAAASTTEWVAPSPSVDISLDLPANHGLRAHLENFEKITLEIERKGRLVTYEVDGEVTETGLKAQFGALGSIDVAFRPTETRLDQPPKNCEGEPSTMSKGFFVGTIQFSGERGYVQIEATRVKGRLSVWRESEWRCSRHHRPLRLHRAPRRSTLLSRERSKASGEPASLLVSNRRCRCFFAAYAEPEGRRPTTFVGAQFEEREGMEIARATAVEAGASAFVFDHKAGTARVRPPQPFSGHGTFKRRPHAPDLWKSTIQVPLLGADPLRTGGPGFRAALVRALPGGE